jgi:hypothetical protein
MVRERDGNEKKERDSECVRERERAEKRAKERLLFSLTLCLSPSASLLG